jgi:hypothetical protein
MIDFGAIGELNFDSKETHAACQPGTLGATEVARAIRNTTIGRNSFPDDCR